ncbi:MAG: D-alanine--D-alanine ligase family protein [Bacillota bacterium]
MLKKRIVLLYGGRSAEHEVSIMSARSVYKNLSSSNYEVIPLLISRDGYWVTENISTQIIKGEREKLQPGYGKKYASIFDSMTENFPREVDLVFPLLHGPYGEDGRIQGFFDTLGVKYIGSATGSSAVAIDKIYTKDILARYNIPQTSYRVINKWEYNKDNDKTTRYEILEEIESQLGFPIFVKPANLGSSIGISKVENEKDFKPAIDKAFKFDDRVLIEKAIQGREIECSVLGNAGSARASLPGEVVPANKFYDYEAKYFSGQTKLITPARLEQDIVEQIQALAVNIFNKLNLSGLARVDFFLESDQNIYLNEVNTMPGFTEKSMYAKMWQASGFNYKNLIEQIIDLAF